MVAGKNWKGLNGTNDAFFEYLQREFILGNCKTPGITSDKQLKTDA